MVHNILKLCDFTEEFLEPDFILVHSIYNLKANYSFDFLTSNFNSLNLSCLLKKSL